MSYELSAQKAIHDALVDSVDLSAVIAGRVYDFVPQDVIFPYVSIGEDASTELDTSSGGGAMVTATIHTWSTQKGRLETKTIQQAIRQALHDSSLTYPGYTIHYCYWVSSQSFVDADGATRHGVIIFNLYISEE